VAQLLGHVGDHPGVGGRRRPQHRDLVAQGAQDLGDAPVVGAEVVAPVADAVGLIHHHQAGLAGQQGQHPGGEAGVVEPLGGDQQQVDLVNSDLVLDRPPVPDVGGVDAGRPDPDPFGGGGLVAHEGEQGGDGESLACPSGPAP
jgi:hypothetical protein